MARTEKILSFSLSIYNPPLLLLRLIFDLPGPFSLLKQLEVVVVFFFSCYPSLRVSSVILVRSGGFLLIDNELRGSKTNEAKSFKMNYLALNFFNLTLKRYNIIHPSRLLKI